VTQGPGEPAPVLSPLYLEDAGLRVGKDPDPVPAPFAGAVGAPTSFRACHRSIPLWMMDRTICAKEKSRDRGISASRGPTDALPFRGRCVHARTAFAPRRDHACGTAADAVSGSGPAFCGVC